MAKQGSLSINSENIFPIIKKWLYSDHDIFIRELVSNGCDAVTKLKKLAVMGEFEEADDEKYKVVVKIKNTDIQTVTIKIPAFSYEQTIKNSGILANAPKLTEEVVNRYLEVAELDENGNHLFHLEGGIPFTPCLAQFHAG